MRFTDSTGLWRRVRSDAPLPVGGGQVLAWLSDDFSAAAVDSALWEVVSGAPTILNSEVNIVNGAVLLSRQQFAPPCLLEVVCTMTARSASDSFRLGFYTHDSNLVEWGATGTTGSNMDARMSAGGISDDQTAINVGAANGSYRLASIYVGLGEVVWAFRTVNSLSTRNEVQRYREHGIPNGPFRVRLAGLAGTSTLRVHRVTAYQLADTVPPGALGHHLDTLALPVRVTNGPFPFTPSSTSLGAIQAATDTFSSLAVGSVATGTTRNFFMEQVHVQAFFMGDQPFSWWVEAQADGSNWQVIGYGSSTDATTDAVVRYFATSSIFQVVGSRSVRVKVRNTGTAAGTFRGTVTASQL